MNKVSHVIISRTISNFYQNYVRPKDDLMFTLISNDYTYGSLKPDMQASFFTQKHTWEESYDTVVALISSILNKEVEPAKLSMTLGEISHYCCDFFNLYHIDTVKYAQLRQHLLYELRLQHFYEVNQVHPHIVNEKSLLAHVLWFNYRHKKPELNDFLNYLTMKKSHYLSETDTYIKDVRYSYIVTTVVVVGLIKRISELYKEDLNLI